ncbi:MAG: D-alanine--D-alanine ligase [Gammaproteobacteria bacterium]|nr:D-alanine--D-alanine ligase [Gammaproteobacteria bacterium]
MHIEIITTPNDALKESGFGSLKACNSVLHATQRMGHIVKLNVCESKACIDDVIKRKPELVILAVKYIPLKNEDDIWLSDYLSQHNVNFTGSSREVLKFDSNKVKAKMHLTNKGIKTARYFIATPGQYKTERELPFTFPLFLKPLDAANGNGIDDLSYITSFDNFENKVASLYDSFNQPVLVEEYLDGREFTVAVIKKNNNELILSAVEIIPPTSTNGLKILGAQAKKDDSEKMIMITDHSIKNRVTTLAANAFNCLGVRDFGRIDIKTNKSGECFFMEANLVPGMTYGSSYFPQACKIANGFDYDKVVELLLASGIARASITTPPNLNPDSDAAIVAL